MKDKNNGKVRSLYDKVLNQRRNIAGQGERGEKFLIPVSKNIRKNENAVDGDVPLNGSHCLMKSQVLIFLDKMQIRRLFYFLILFLWRWGGGSLA